MCLGASNTSVIAVRTSVYIRCHACSLFANCFILKAMNGLSHYLQRIAMIKAMLFLLFLFFFISERYSLSPYYHRDVVKVSLRSCCKSFNYLTFRKSKFMIIYITETSKSHIIKYSNLKSQSMWFLCRNTNTQTYEYSELIYV